LLVDKRQIEGKDVYIFESHSTALVPWGQIRSKRSNAPNLITLDYHTDTHEAFLLHYGKQFKGEYFSSGDDAFEKLRELLLSKIDVLNDASLCEAANKLRNDEHIDAAIGADIIDFAYVISYDGQCTQSREEIKYYEENYGGVNFIRTRFEGPQTPLPTRPYTYDVPESKIFVVDDSEGFEYNKNSKVDQEKQHYDFAIESPYLDRKLLIIDEMGLSAGVKNVLAQDYILDIDLDYFKTRKSIEPRDKKTFYHLIKSAQAVTIAMEPYFVNEEKYPGEEIDPEFLLAALLEHIHSSLVT